MIDDKGLALRIKEAEAEVNSARLVLDKCRKAFTNAESIFINKKINYEKLVEDMRIHISVSHLEPDDLYDAEIKRFTEALPALLEKDKWLIKK